MRANYFHLLLLAKSETSKKGDSYSSVATSKQTLQKLQAHNYNSTALKVCQPFSSAP